MENVDLESENRSELHFDDIAGGSEAVRRAVGRDRDGRTGGFHPPDQRRERLPAGTHSIGLSWRSRARSPAALT